MKISEPHLAFGLGNLAGIFIHSVASQFFESNLESILVAFCASLGGFFGLIFNRE
jgi:sulfite exporter TauE/SafE